MERFVRVRLIEVNNLDLSVFQFDPDLSIAFFFLNADKTVYGRYGTRSDFYESDRDISLEGLREAMSAALELHAAYPGNAATLREKTASAPRYEVLTQYPWLKQRGATEGCLHCHHLQAAEHMFYRDIGLPIPDKVLFPWPMPDVIGLRMDPREKATVAEVLHDSAAQAAGFKQGDEILSMKGQPIVSTADVQWVLTSASVPAKIQVAILREGQTRELTLTLKKGWRQRSEISWRATTGLLRRNSLGTLWLEDLSSTRRRTAGLADDVLALRVSRIVRPGTLAAVAGFRTGDVLVSFDGRHDRMTESQLLAYAVQKKTKGEQVPVTVLRGERRIDLKLPIQ